MAKFRNLLIQEIDDHLQNHAPILWITRRRGRIAVVSLQSKVNHTTVRVKIEEIRRNWGRSCLTVGCTREIPTCCLFLPI